MRARFIRRALRTTAFTSLVYNALARLVRVVHLATCLRSRPVCGLRRDIAMVENDSFGFVPSGDDFVERVIGEELGQACVRLYGNLYLSSLP